MADLQALEELATETPPAETAPVHVQKLDALGRAYATGKRKDAIARVWLSPGAGRIIVNTKDFTEYFARPVLQMVIQQPIVAAGRNGQYDVRATRFRRRFVRTGGCATARHLQGSDILRAGAAHGPQEGRVPDPRLPHRGAQEIRQAQGPTFVPVLQALTAQLFPYC